MTIVTKPPKISEGFKLSGPWSLWRRPTGGSASKDADLTPFSQMSWNNRAYGAINTEYRYRKSKGMLIQPTPWLQYRDEFAYTSGVYDISNASIRHWIVGSPITFWFTTEPSALRPNSFAVITKIQNQDTDYFVQAAAAKIYSSGWDALTFTAELSKTVAMFRGILSRLTQLAREGKLERMWLESRYGWRTLIYDLEDLNKAIRDLDDKRARFIERAGTTSMTTTSSFVNFGGASSFDCRQETTVTEKISLRGTVVADISPPDFQFNPIITAWELTRLSFVVDWVINVGQFLESLSFLTLQREHYASGGVSLEQDAVSSGYVYNWKNGFSGQLNYDAYYKVRCVMRTPKPVSTIPQIRLRLDWLKLIDLVSLFLQALRR